MSQDYSFLFVFSDPQGGPISDEEYHDWYFMTLRNINDSGTMLNMRRHARHFPHSTPLFGIRRSMPSTLVSPAITNTSLALLRQMNTNDCLPSVQNVRQISSTRSSSAVVSINCSPRTEMRKLTNRRRSLFTRLSLPQKERRKSLTVGMSMNIFLW